MPGIESLTATRFAVVVDRVCGFSWGDLTRDELAGTAHAYYYFSIQFRENLEIARKLYPDDRKLIQLEAEECNTDNLSPWPGVASIGEKLNHDEFMRRLLLLSSIDDYKAAIIDEAGESYLSQVRAMDSETRALSIASYEDGGLERVFRAFLKCRAWDGPLLQAFRHFVTEHIRFDSDPEQGHGALSRHLVPDDRILPLWTAFEHHLVSSVPKLAATA